jgi:signal transduction histidine kinase
MQFIYSQTQIRVFSQLRTRILAAYILLMSLFAVVPVVVFCQILANDLEVSVEKAIAHEIEEFQLLVTKRNPTTGQPFGNDVAAMFDTFLASEAGLKNRYIITYLDGKFYKSNSQHLPEALQPNSKKMQSWASTVKPEKGKEISKFDIVLYHCEPIILRYSGTSTKIDENSGGVIIVAQLITEEYKQLNQLMILVFCVAGLGAIVAWVLTERVLVRLRLLTETTRSITETDLTQRIVVKGGDEIAELTITINQMLDRLQAAFTSQRDFINDAGHELRTPITIIRGYLELLNDDPQERQKTVEIIDDELERMSRFVSDLLLLAKTEQPNFLTLDIVDIDLLTEEIGLKARALGDRHWDLDHKASGYIVADRYRLTQAVINLAENATQHTNNKDAITIGSKIVNGSVRLWVRDTGEGIALSDQERIFQRFARATNSCRRSEGAGLGLSIVKAIAIAHGGDIELVSRPGSGSTFTIVIPIEPPQPVLV